MGLVDQFSFKPFPYPEDTEEHLLHLFSRCDVASCVVAFALYER